MQIKKLFLPPRPPEKKKMEFGIHKDRYEKMKETIKNIFEGTTEELNELVESYDTTLMEKNNEIIEV